MYRCGVVITVFYAVVVVVLFPSVWHWLQWPTVDILGGEFVSRLSHALGWMYRDWFVWTWAGMLVSGQAILLFLSADTPWRQARPRQYLAGIVLTVALLAALLTVAGFWSLEILAHWSLRAAGIPENIVVSLLRLLWAISPMDRIPDTYFRHLGWWLGLWAIWAAALYRYTRVSRLQLATALLWLFKGSVLALIFAVSAHVAVLRDKWSWLFADMFTAFYIVTAVGIMLLCFGPSVLALYKKRHDSYSRKREQSA